MHAYSALMPTDLSQVWDESFLFVVESTESVVVVEVWDQDRLRKDEVCCVHMHTQICMCDSYSSWES